MTEQPTEQPIEWREWREWIVLIVFFIVVFSSILLFFYDSWEKTKKTNSVLAKPVCEDWIKIAKEFQENAKLLNQWAKEENQRGKWYKRLYYHVNDHEHSSPEAQQFWEWAKKLKQYAKEKQEEAKTDPLCKTLDYKYYSKGFLEVAKEDQERAKEDQQWAEDYLALIKSGSKEYNKDFLFYKKRSKDYKAISKRNKEFGLYLQKKIKPEKTEK